MFPYMNVTTAVGTRIGDGMTESVKSAQRVMQIVELLTGSGSLTFPEISEELALPRSSLHGLLATMSGGGFLGFDEQSRRYHLGIRLWEAGQAYDRDRNLVRSAMPVLRAIRDELNETAQLAIRDGADNVYVAKVEADQKLVLVSHVGSRLPAYATGLGKALLAGLPDAEVQGLYADTPMMKYTDKTITAVNDLLERLATVRKRGYATDDGEYTPGVFCVAAPVRNATGLTVAAMSVSVPTVRVDATARRRMVRAVGRGAAQLSRELGFMAAIA